MEQKKKKPTVTSLIETISKLKIEHQRTVFTLNKKNEKLKADLSIANRENIENQNTIVSLQNENQLLATQIEQLKEQLQSAVKPTKNTNYAVENIIDDKVVNKKKYYLVRWEGFGEKDDSWEPRKNLNCPYLLDKYEQSKNQQ